MAYASLASSRGLSRLTAPSCLSTRARSRRAVTVYARKTATKTAYICIDCGWIYDGKEPFEKLPNSFKCPVCQAPKRRFRKTEGAGKNDAKSMRSRYEKMSDTDGKFDEGDKQFFGVAAAGAVVLLAGLYFFLNSQTSL